MGNTVKKPYKKEYAKRAKQYAKEGKTDAEISKSLGISCRLFYRWKKCHSDFEKAVRLGKTGPDMQVEASMFKHALGYDYIETTTEKVGKRWVVTKKVVKHVPGNATLMIFWSINRQRAKWQDTRKIEVQGDLRTTYKVIHSGQTGQTEKGKES